MHPDQLKHSQLPTAHIATVEQGRPVEQHELSMINSNLGKLAMGKEITGHERLVEGWQLATHDKLMPQMLNRDGLDEWFERYRPEHAGVMLLDIKGFKKFNDVHGQKVGDEILQYVGKNFLRNLRMHRQEAVSGEYERRNVDALDQLARNKDEAGARYGGDEFMAVINLDDVEESKREDVMETIQKRLSKFDNFSFEDGELPINIHSAFHISNDPAENIDGIYEKLSPALAEAKQVNKGLVA